MNTQKVDLRITAEEIKELNGLKNKAGELSLKDKKRLAVLQRLWEDSNGGAKAETVASREKKDLGTTKDDYYREGSKKVFTTDEETNRNCRYEYVTEVKTAESGKNAEFARKNKMKSIIKDTEYRCELLERLLRKRPLTSIEEQELKDLKIKKDANRADYDEDVRYGELMSIKILQSEQTFTQFIQGVQKCYYYKDAHKTLLPGVSFREWNMDVSTSKEPANIMDICDKNKHASIAVFNQDPIDYAAKLRNPKYNQNPVVVLDCSRMGPGGSWSRGDEGIEEQAFLRTTISLAIDKEINDHFYPLRNESVLYTPKTIVFRHNRATDYKTSPETASPDFQSFILASGIVVKQTDIKGDEVTDRKEENERPEQEIYMEKIKNCLATAAFNGHDSIIFTALGCYNYGKSFHECADAFLYAVFDPSTKFYRRFKSIIFCVPPDIIPNTEKIIEEIENGVLRKKRQIFDHNMELFEVLKSKLQQITFQDIEFSSINLNTRIMPRKLMSDAFNSLKI